MKTSKENNTNDKNDEENHSELENVNTDLLDIMRQNLNKATDQHESNAPQLHTEQVESQVQQVLRKTHSVATIIRPIKTMTTQDDEELIQGEEVEVEVHDGSFAQTLGVGETILHSHGVVGPFVNAYQAHRPEDDDAASVPEDDDHVVFPIPDERGRIINYPRNSSINTAASSLEEKPHDLEAADYQRNEASSDDHIVYDDDGEVMERETEQLLRKEAPRSVVGAGLESIKYLYSMALLIFSVIVVMAAIFSNQTVGTAQLGIPPVAAFFIFWFLICWLAMMEGGQGALVGLQPIEPCLYAQTHPRAAMSTKLVGEGDNLERFIVGRQFLVVLVVFVMNMMGSAVSDANVLGLTGPVKEVFVSTGVALILVAITLGQLTAQINSANCMLDFINNYFMVGTTYLSLAIEYSGLLHSVYLVQKIFTKLSADPEEDDPNLEDAPRRRSVWQTVFFWSRAALSLAILCYALAVTLKALFDGNTTMWKGVPSVVSVIILFVLMAFVGMMEGMQIALFAVINLPEEDLAKHNIAHKNCQLVFQGQNLPAFLIGRQILVTICMFVVARITTLDITVGEDNIFGVSDGVQEFFNTGLLGAVITTIIASLIWRIIASSFPIVFLSNPLIYVIIRLCLLLEASGVCSSSWILARYHKPMLNFQPDEVHLDGAEPHGWEPVTRRDKDIDRLVMVVKFIYSLALLAFAVVLVMAAIFQEQTTGTAKGIPPVAAFFIFWFLIFWLAKMEGGQGALVALEPIDKGSYSESHPVTLMNTNLVHKGDNMERFIVGRQFLVVIVVFVTNMMASSIPNAQVLGLNSTVMEIFLDSGLALILVTIVIGQLTAQVNGADCMLDFLNSHFMLFTTYVSLAIEMSGVLHCVYLVQIIFSFLTGTPIESTEGKRSAVQQVFFWGRVVFSLAVLGFAFAVTLKALVDGNTTMWEGVPIAVSVFVFFLIMCFVGIMEGMQIALFAVVNLPDEELQKHHIAYANCKLTFGNQNLQAFLIGRQVVVTICMFVVARITTLDVTVGEDNIFGISDGVQEFFNTGLLGAVITTVVASLIWRILASTFPLAFLSNPFLSLVIRLCLFVEASGVCSAAWMLGRWCKLILGYQPDEVYLEGAPRHTKDPVTRRDKDVDVTVTVIKYLYSLLLLAFSVAIVMGTIFDENTKLSQSVHPAVAFVVIWALVLWLAMMEGGQGCLVGLQPVDKDLYKESHPITLISTKLAHKGDNMERFIVGRQFLVVLVVFVINMCGAALEGTQVFSIPAILNDIFVGSGVALILMTIILGQLAAQVNASNCMLDFINNYFMVFTTYMSLMIEFTGLLHSVYLVQILFSKISGKAVESREPPRSPLQKLFFWLRVLVSITVLILAFVVTLTALFAGKTSMWEGVPKAVSVVLFFILMCFVGLMEGMQIALFAVVNLPEQELESATLVQKTCQLTFSGNNLQAFLIGRQILVTICMFVVARISTINVDIDGGEGNVLGVSDELQAFFNTGLLGAIITTIVASLAWRIVASSFPVAFLSNPLVYLIIRLCLAIEATGVCASAWLLALIHKAIAGFEVDEEHFRASANHEEQKTPDSTVADKKDLLQIEEGSTSMSYTS